jgi:hypothetical protein
VDERIPGLHFCLSQHRLGILPIQDSPLLLQFAILLVSYFDTTAVFFSLFAPDEPTPIFIPKLDYLGRLYNLRQAAAADAPARPAKMPGILPMKVIKVGGTQSRIAQACDRCRSKKIRCDGIRPCCTQCANVGFECKTSDKLSRRAFPRGYTESLEERVRTLEAEVKDLKDLLDEKDEKIDVLSRIHSFSSPSQRASSVRSPSTTGPTKSPVSDAGEGVIHVEKPSTQSGSKKSSQNPYSAFSTTLGFACRFRNLIFTVHTE